MTPAEARQELARRELARRRAQTPEYRRQDFEAVATDRGRRAVMRATTPMGLGFITQPLADLVTDSHQRGVVGRNIGDAFNAIRTQHVDLPQLAGDTFAAGSRAVNGFTSDPLGATGRFIGALPQAVAGMTYQPFVDNANARDEQVLAQTRGDNAGADQAAERAVAGAGGIATNTAGALLGPLARTPLMGGLLAAGLTAPNAIANGQGSLQERLPQALVDTAGAGVIGASVPAIANAGVRALNMPTRAQQLARSFEQANVDPSIAALNAGTFGGTMTGAMTNAIADNPVAGIAVRPRIGRQLEQAAAESRRIQAGYGSPSNPEGAGALVQRGLRRYATDKTAPNPAPHADPRTIDTSDWSVPAQSEAIYDHVLRPVEGNTTTLNNTVQAIRDVEALADNDPVVQRTWSDKSLRTITDAAHELYTRPNQPLTLRATRELRRRLRLRLESPAEGQDMASLRRVYGALSQDIYDAAGPAAADLRRADAFYARHMDRIQNVLNRVVNVSDSHAISPTQSFQAIFRAAQVKTGNSRMLVALARSLRPDEMRTLAASLLDYMGQPTGGAGGTQAAELGFSVNTLSTNLRNMSPLAKRIIFGSSNSRLAAELDNLARVTDALKGVERTTNATGSGRYANLGVSGLAVYGAATSGMWLWLTAGLGATVGLGEALTNPMFVRWLASASRQPASAGGARQMLANLAKIASRDPAILPVYNQLARAQQQPEPYQQAQSR